MPSTLIKASIESGGRMAIMAYDSYGRALQIDELDSVKSSARLNWTISVNVEYTFTILHKHFSDAYEVTTENGTAYISGTTVKYTPAIIGAGGFALNGTFHPMTITANQPLQPAITLPVADTLYPTTEVALTSSAFVAEDATVTHTSTRWQVATDPDFLNIVMDVTSTTGLTGIAATGLSRGKTYYTRSKHIGTKP